MNVQMCKHCGTTGGMAKLIDQLRNAIETCGKTRYRISKEAGIAESVLSRFMRGENVLTITNAERLADYFELEIVLRSKRRRGPRGG